MVSAFKEKIAAALSGVINSDYIFLDTPYYTNIGDILIWQGTEDFLSALPYRCLYRCSVETYQKPEISEQAIIILNGGGNFGDLWRRHTEFLLRILRDFPRNKIVVFPQTVFYQNEAQLKKDAEQMAFHTNITICARDTASFTILQTYFNRHTILLVPDMAFCISGSRLDTLRRKQTNKTLFLRRGDKELNRGINYFDYIPEKDLDVRDWPSMEKRTAVSFLLMQLLRISRRIPVLFPKLTDVYASLFFKPVMIKTGVQFLSAYRKVYTTRLHAAILCCLLRKPCTFFDNSYGKNSSFFNTWLYDLDGIEFVPPPPPVER